MRVSLVEKDGKIIFFWSMVTGHIDDDIPYHSKNLARLIRATNAKCLVWDAWPVYLRLSKEAQEQHWPNWLLDTRL